MMVPDTLDDGEILEKIQTLALDMAEEWAEDFEESSEVPFCLDTDAIENECSVQGTES